MREGKRLRTEHIEVRIDVSPLVQYGETDQTRLRVGIIVPRFKHSAVARNRLKRRIRELVRVVLLPGGPLLNVVLRTMPHAYAASFDALGKDIQRAQELLMRWHAEHSLVPRPDAAVNGEGQ